MRGVLLFLCSVLSLACPAPLYGANGGYKGYASYVPISQSDISRTSLQSGDSIDTSAGSHEIISEPPKSGEDSSAYAPEPVPDKYNALGYNPGQHGYGDNSVSEESPDSPYHRATLYGQSEGGFKISDSFKSREVDSHEDDQSSYSDDGSEELSHPQSYEYGYALKDRHGNSQHKHETSDGQGNVKGSYGFTDENGIYRSVEYVAGKDGFKASIKTNEPGTLNQDPAHVYVRAETPEHE